MLSTYELRYLLEHLTLTDGRDDVRKLMTLETSSGRNSWYELKLAQGLVDTYLEDLRLAGAVEESALSNPSAPFDTNLTSIIRYAGMRSSLVQRASNIPASLLRQLVLSGIWTIERCFRHAISLPYPEQRCASLCVPFPMLDRATRQACFEHALGAIHQLAHVAGNALARFRRKALRQLCEVLVQANERLLVIKRCEIDAGWTSDEPTAWMLAEYLANGCEDQRTIYAEAAHTLIQGAPTRWVTVAPALYGLLNDAERDHVWMSERAILELFHVKAHCVLSQNHGFASCILRVAEDGCEADVPSAGGALADRPER